MPTLRRYFFLKHLFIHTGKKNAILLTQGITFWTRVHVRVINKHKRGNTVNIFKWVKSCFLNLEINSSVINTFMKVFHKIWSCFSQTVKKIMLKSTPKVQKSHWILPQVNFLGMIWKNRGFFPFLGVITDRGLPIEKLRIFILIFYMKIPIIKSLKILGKSWTRPNPNVFSSSSSSNTIEHLVRNHLSRYSL